MGTESNRPFISGPVTVQYPPRRPRNLIRGLADDEIQIIGIEFTVTTDHGQAQELAMFSPQGLIIPRLRSAAPSAYDKYRPKITFHTTDGDHSVESYACPW